MTRHRSEIPDRRAPAFTWPINLSRSPTSNFSGVNSAHGPKCTLPAVQTIASTFAIFWKHGLQASQLAHVGLKISALSSHRDDFMSRRKLCRNRFSQRSACADHNNFHLSPPFSVRLQHCVPASPLSHVRRLFASGTNHVIIFHALAHCPLSFRLVRIFCSTAVGACRARNILAAG